MLFGVWSTVLWDWAPPFIRCLIWTVIWSISTWSRAWPSLLTWINLLRSLIIHSYIVCIIIFVFNQTFINMSCPASQDLECGHLLLFFAVPMWINLFPSPIPFLIGNPCIIWLESPLSGCLDISIQKSCSKATNIVAGVFIISSLSSFIFLFLAILIVIQ